MTTATRAAEAAEVRAELEELLVRAAARQADEATVRALARMVATAARIERGER